MIWQQRVEDLPVARDRFAKAGATVSRPPIQKSSRQVPPATKASIVISLIGLILTVLTFFGPFMLVAEPIFRSPIALLLVGLTVSAVVLMVVGMVYLA